MTNGDEAQTPGTGSYAEVNGLDMYYEIHGSGEPLILLMAASARSRCSAGSCRCSRKAGR